MNNYVEIEDSEKKDHYLISVNGVSWGEWEGSQVRQAIEVFDNKITVQIRE